MGLLPIDNHMASKGKWAHWHESWGDGIEEHYWTRCGFEKGETIWLPVCKPLSIRAGDHHLRGGWRRSRRCKACKQVVDDYIRETAGEFYLGS